MAKQLFFDFYQPKLSSCASNCFENFILSQENQQAYQELRNFLGQKKFPEFNPELGDSMFNHTTLILSGEQSCGKSHLLQTLSRDFAARFLVPEMAESVCSSEINSLNIVQEQQYKTFAKNLPFEFEENQHFLLDNASEISQEELLFLLNYSFEKKSFLTLVLPENWKPSLPDLASRIVNLPHTLILSAEIELLLQILAQKLAQKQIFLEKKVLDLISKNSVRSYQFFEALAKKIEFSCFESGEKFSLNKAKKILNL